MIYGCIMLYMSQIIFSSLGLMPNKTRMEAHHGVDLKGLDRRVFHMLELIGPSVILISHGVSIKKRNSIKVLVKCLLFWAFTFYTSFFSKYIAISSDLLFVSLTTWGIYTVSKCAWDTALAVSPTVAIVLVDLNTIDGFSS
ncbi:hypothetical protein HDV06_004978 [Boothiomyces sp. JEL0866]|nr:hypothetical protein HDV06_004945 [Boothiomyces sp. JEL0866]KAJ3325221.1 hypothetical protein HDV06_004978 [Boothiomyces sp. JEL0866]